MWFSGCGLGHRQCRAVVGSDGNGESISINSTVHDEEDRPMATKDELQAQEKSSCRQSSRENGQPILGRGSCLLEFL